MIVRHGRWRSVFLCAGLLLAAGPAALGDATITSDLRYIEVSADATDLFGSTTGLLTTIVPTSPGALFVEGAEWNLTRPSGAASARSIADQDSTLSSLVFSSFTVGLGSVQVNGNVELDGISSQAFAESNFELNFSIADPHDYTFSGSMAKSATGTTVRAILKHLGGADVFSMTDAGSFDDSGTLPAGDYTLELLARANRFVLDGATYFSSASFRNVMFDLVLVPEPGTLALLGLNVMFDLVAALALRRRRRVQ